MIETLLYAYYSCTKIYELQRWKKMWTWVHVPVCYEPWVCQLVFLVLDSKTLFILLFSQGKKFHFLPEKLCICVTYSVLVEWNFLPVNLFSTKVVQLFLKVFYLLNVVEEYSDAKETFLSCDELPLISSRVKLTRCVVMWVAGRRSYV